MEEYMEQPLGAEALGEKLEEIYQIFEDRITEKDEGERTFLKTLRQLFSDKRDTDDDVRAFHNTVGNHITKLYDALKEESPEKAGEIAERALHLMLDQKGKWSNDVVSLSKVSNQGFAAPLLEFLPKEQLAALREDYLKWTPKRLMFPNQRDVLQKMDELLADTNELKS